MPKTAKIVLLVIAGLLVLLIAAAAIFAATFNPNDYKPQLIRTVQEKTQRTLSIPGDISLRFFPKLGARLGPLSISEQGGKAEFAAVDSASVSLALLPLLSREVVVDRVEVEGLRANIKRFKDGSTNYDDLLKKEEKTEAGAQTGEQGEKPLVFDIDGIKLANAHIDYEDQQAGRRIELGQMSLETGKIANGVPSSLRLKAQVKSSKPAVDASVNAKSGFTLDLPQQHVVLDKLDAEIKGALAGFTGLVLRAAGDADLRPAAKRFALEGIKLSASGKRGEQQIEANFDIPKLAITDAGVSGGKLSGDARMRSGTRDFTANLSAPSFEGSPQAFKIPALSLNAVVMDAGLNVQAKLSGALTGDIDKLLFASPQLALNLSGKQDGKAISGSLTTPFSANLKNKIIELSAIAANFTLPNPGGGTLAMRASGNVGAHLDKETLTAALKGTLDESAFDAKLGLNAFSPPAYNFNVGIDRLDLDRYRAKPAAGGSGTPQAKTNAGNKATKEEPLDLSALQNLRANGSVRVGNLKAVGVHASNVRFDLRAANGRLDIEPLAANLYGGSLAGSLSMAAAKPARFEVRQTLSSVEVGPLLKDAIAKQPIEGKGNVRLDVAASGMTFSQIKQGLNGSARLELRDGAVHGINIAQAVRNAKAKLGALRGDAPEQGGTASVAEKTDFSELSGSFRITNGIARNDDLDVKSPLIRIGGSGDIDLGRERIDYLAKATVVSTLQGQGGPELQELKGVTVPVRLSGPFTSINWRIDFAGLVKEMAQQRIDEKKEEVRSKAQKALEDEKSKVREQLKGGLKGLFGK